MATPLLFNAFHWRNVGRKARAVGAKLETVLTSNAAVNGWIRQGYGS